MSLQNGTTVKKETKAKTKTTAQALAKKVVKATPAPVVKNHNEIIKQRMDKRTKLSTLYKDIDALDKAQKDFDSIQSYGDVRVVIHCGNTPTFTTTRQDTVEGVLQTIQNNISQKFAKAQKELADFEF